MEYDPENALIQYQLTKICQVIANQNSRRVLEMLAAAPMTFDDLRERIDLRPDQLRCAIEMMIRLDLVQKSGGGTKNARFTEVKPLTYGLAGGGGLFLVRSWLDRIAAISVGERYSN
jgi:hypothetical protein